MFAIIRSILVQLIVTHLHACYIISCPPFVCHIYQQNILVKSSKTTLTVKINIDTHTIYHYHHHHLYIECIQYWVYTIYDTYKK